MGKSPRITAEVAEVLLESFRQAPGVALRAASRAGCDPRTARKAWRTGLRAALEPRYHEPFEAILAREQDEVRARVKCEQDEALRRTAKLEAERQQGVREKVLEDQTEQRAHEEMLIRNARAATIVLLSNITQISAGVQALGGKVRGALEDRAKDPERLTLKQAKDVIGMVRGLSTGLRQCNDAALRAMEMSRLLVGEPTSITAVHHMGAIPLSEAKEQIAAAQRAVAELEREGATVIDSSLEPVKPAKALSAGPEESSGEVGEGDPALN